MSDFAKQVFDLAVSLNRAYAEMLQKTPDERYEAEYFVCLGCNSLKVSTKPWFKKFPKEFLSSLVKPALRSLPLGPKISISLCATFRSPHHITGFYSSIFLR